jgi:hypothetical protein
MRLLFTYISRRRPDRPHARAHGACGVTLLAAIAVQHAPPTASNPHAARTLRALRTHCAPTPNTLRTERRTDARYALHAEFRTITCLPLY